MSDQKVATKIITPEETLAFQQYMVHRRCRDTVRQVLFEGAVTARPAPGVLEAIGGAKGVVICPSNPIISIGTILAVPGVRETLRQTVAPIVAVSPIVRGQALKGPADRMLRDLGHEASAYGVATLYRDFVDVFIIDHRDESLAERIERLGLQVIVANTIMTGPLDRASLAGQVLAAFERAHKAVRAGKAR